MAVACVLSAYWGGIAPGTSDWIPYQTDSRHAHLTLRFPDHSVIDLDAYTQIEVRMGKDLREVRLLRGRALFRVERAPEPFLVWAGPARIAVLGTVFSVAHQGHGEILTMVSEGRLNVSSALSPAQLVQSGEAIRVRGERVLAAYHPQSDSLRPVNGVFEFLDTPLWQAVSAFNRYNAVQLVIMDPKIANERVGGQFNAHEPVSFARALDELGIGYVLAKSVGSPSDQIQLTAHRR